MLWIVGALKPPEWDIWTLKQKIVYCLVFKAWMLAATALAVPFAFWVGSLVH